MTNTSKTLSATTAKTIEALRARDERELAKEIAALLSLKGATKHIGRRAAAAPPSHPRAAKQTREQSAVLHNLILAVLRATPGVGMAILLAGLKDYTSGQVGYALNALKESGAVIQHGTRKGATYTAAGTEVSTTEAVSTSAPEVVVFSPPPAELVSGERTEGEVILPPPLTSEVESLPA